MGRILAVEMDHGETTKIKASTTMETTIVAMAAGAIRGRIITHQVTIKEGTQGLGSLALKKESSLAQFASMIAREAKW